MMNPERYKHSSNREKSYDLRELMLKQSKGEYLTDEEKRLVSLGAERRRKNRK